MTRLASLLAAALTLAACTPAPPASSGAVAPTAIDRADASLAAIEARAARLATIVDFAIAFFPASAPRLRAGQALVAGALHAARAALTVAQRDAALRDARIAADRIDAAVGLSTVTLNDTPPAG